jgi:hypothetical protein
MSILSFRVYTVTLTSGVQIKLHARSHKRAELVNGVPCCVFELYPGIAKSADPIPEAQIAAVDYDVQHCTGREIARMEGDPNWEAMVGGETAQRVSAAEKRLEALEARIMNALGATEETMRAHRDETVERAKDAREVANELLRMMHELAEAEAAHKASSIGMEGR